MKAKFIYILIKENQNIRLLYHKKVWFAEHYETRLHNMFCDKRIEEIKESDKSGVFTKVIKIGISNNTKARIENIKEDLKSGKTEWFKLNDFEIVCVRLWVWVFWVRPYFYFGVFLILISTFLIL